MPNDLIRYDLLVQEALCGVVSRVLADAARHGLPGDHHFYITFRTHAPGVRLSSRMREQYPDEMTIILQHQFEDLKVTEHGFEVGLSFKGIPEILLIPFDALTGFFDPSVQFSLKFEPQPEEDGQAQPVPEPQKPASLATLPQPVRTALPAPVGLPVPARPVLAEVKPTGVKPTAAKPTGAKPPGARPAGAKASEPVRAEHATEANANGGESDAGAAKVVSIDAFRKKP